METAAENLENAGTSDEIEELEEQIADCTITAGASGTITTLNATVGSAAGRRYLQHGVGGHPEHRRFEGVHYH